MFLHVQHSNLCCTEHSNTSQIYKWWIFFIYTETDRWRFIELTINDRFSKLFSIVLWHVLLLHKFYAIHHQLDIWMYTKGLHTLNMVKLLKKNFNLKSSSVGNTFHLSWGVGKTDFASIMELWGFQKNPILSVIKWEIRKMK